MKNIKSTYQFIILLTIAVLFFVALGVFLWLSDLFLTLWVNLSSQPVWFIILYVVLFILFIVLSLILLSRFLPKSNKKTETNKNNSNEAANETAPINAVELQTKIDVLQEKEIDTTKIQVELDKLKDKQQHKDIVIVLFGDISSGKSSLIKAILPSSEGKISVIGGTTDKVIRYEWLSPIGEKIIVIDTPGFDEVFQMLEKKTKESIYTAHLAIYLCEGDLTANQYHHIKEIVALDKPAIVAVNKTDRYSSNDLAIIMEQVSNKLAQIASELALVSIQTGGVKEVTLVYPDGTEKTEQREIAINLNDLLQKVEQLLNQNSLSHLESLRQKSVLGFLHTQLEETVTLQQAKKAQEVVQSSTKKAVVAAMASITPGTDILIQGYLGAQMVKELCVIYDVPATSIDIEKLLSLLQKNTVGLMPILLGIAGNAFKAFPGIGTVTGGVLHAVTYGLIFDSIGRAVSLSLSTHGELSIKLIDDLYKQKLIEKVESRTYELAKTVISNKLMKNK